MYEFSHSLTGFMVENWFLLLVVLFVFYKWIFYTVKHWLFRYVRRRRVNLDPEGSDRTEVIVISNSTPRQPPSTFGPFSSPRPSRTEIRNPVNGYRRSPGLGIDVEAEDRAILEDLRASSGNVASGSQRLSDLLRDAALFERDRDSFMDSSYRYAPIKSKQESSGRKSQSADDDIRKRKRKISIIKNKK